MSRGPVRRGRIGRRLLVGILLVSSLITVAGTGLQLALDYRRDLDGIESRLDEIGSTRLDGLSRALWVVDEALVLAQLEGVLSLREVERVDLEVVEGDDITLGRLRGRDHAVRDYELRTTYRGEPRLLGTMRVHASKDEALQRLRSRLLVILATQGVKTFLVSAAILLLFTVLAGRHLEALARFARDLGGGRVGTSFSLDRIPSEPAAGDELDDLVEALEEMRRHLLGRLESASLRSEDLERQIAIRDRELDEERLQRRLQEAQKLESLGLLAGGVAHDFNNLLVGILGNASLALQAVPPDAPDWPLLEQVVLAARRASELTRQILAYSGRGRFVIGAVDLREAVREMADLLRPSLPAGVRLRLDLPDQLPRVHGDGSQLRQVMMNLITNAAEALDGGGEVRVRLRALPPFAGRSQVELEVEDDGRGMDPSTRERMFEPFFTTKASGHGLGLAAVLGIVRGHQGEIEVDSLPGSGTCVRVRLPVVEAEAWEEADGDTISERTPPARGARVLVVDDEPMVRALAKRVLERAEFVVEEAADGEQALALFSADPARFDLVVLDVTMPVMGGPEAYAAMLRVDPEVRVLMSSGYDEDEIRGDPAVDRPPVGFLHKPYTSEELLRAVREALHAR